MKFKVALLFGLISMGRAGSPVYFSPSHRISGVGAGRDDLSADVLRARTNLMVQAQTFAIMREQQALAGAKRIIDPKLQSIFRSAAQSSGMPENLIEAIAYLESFGDPQADSGYGPKGIMQLSEAAAHDVGLKVVRATRYKVTRVQVAVKSKSTRPKYKTVTHKEPYTVMLRDDRLTPARAIPAASQYLALLERQFGSEDWAIFAYHCGPGCVTYMKGLTTRARGIPADEVTVPRMFFSCSPIWNRELYLAIQQQMTRDWSPTYYFRIRRAQQLLALYREDSSAFVELQQQYRNQFAAGPRAPHRLSAWLRPDDLIYRTEDDIRTNPGALLIKAPDSSQFLGYSLQLGLSPATGLPEDSPAALGTLTYIAFETRRLYEELNTAEPFQPLPVTALVEPGDFARQLSQREAAAHSSGQVFDVAVNGLPASEMECLRFVLDDLEWSGYLGYVEEGPGRLHIGCSPDSREFFANVWQEAEEHLSVN